MGEKILSPGEQSVLYGNNIDVNAVDPRFAVDWKNGEFRFKNEPLSGNSYPNSLDTKTTLLEGSIKVKGTVGEKILSPGEQSVLYGNNIDVNAVDPRFAVDWKNGEFRFKNEPLSGVMQKLSRWYGVQFVMNLRSEQMPSFSGSVSRFDNISEVLKMLEETGNIKFYINGKLITVK